MKERVKKELDRIEKLDVIQKVDKPTDWVNAIIVFEKANGKLRICLDPRPVDQMIKRQHYRLPTAEEIISQMAEEKFFSKLDASNQVTGISKLMKSLQSYLRLEQLSVDTSLSGCPMGFIQPVKYFRRKYQG